MATGRGNGSTSAFFAQGSRPGAKGPLQARRPVRCASADHARLRALDPVGLEVPIRHGKAPAGLPQ